MKITVYDTVTVPVTCTASWHLSLWKSWQQKFPRSGARECWYLEQQEAVAPDEGWILYLFERRTFWQQPGCTRQYHGDQWHQVPHRTQPDQLYRQSSPQSWRSTCQRIVHLYEMLLVCCGQLGDVPLELLNPRQRRHGLPWRRCLKSKRPKL